jgi:acetyltransferase-like isoleucine patch superfamily enzyme
MKAIISTSIRVRHPESFVVGEDSIIDDFCYFSTKVRVGRCSHIASGCTVAGGADRQFTLGDFSSLSSGVRVWCASDDFARDLVTIIPAGVADPKRHVIAGDVVFEDYTAVGANSVVMPANVIPEGTVIGALSFVPPKFAFQPWSVYAGVPLRRVGERDRAAVTAQADALRMALDARATR